MTVYHQIQKAIDFSERHLDMKENADIRAAAEACMSLRNFHIHNSYYINYSYNRNGIKNELSYHYLTNGVIMKKKVVISVFLVLIIALFLFRTFSPKAGTTPREGFRRGGRGRTARGPVAVETAEIKYGGIAQHKEFIGTIKASFTNVIASKVSGRLSTLSKRVGDRIERNEVVGTIEDTEYRHNVEEALAQTKIEAAGISRKLQEEKLNTEQARFAAGKFTEYLVLQVQRDLISSQLDETRAQVAYCNAIINLYLKDGTLLERRGVRSKLIHLIE